MLIFQEYILRMWKNILWIWKDIFLRYKRIFPTYPAFIHYFSCSLSFHIPSYPIISTYQMISFNIHIDFHVHILSYPYTYQLISFYFSILIHFLILLHILSCPHWYPITYPWISKYLSFDIHWYPDTYPLTSFHLSCWVFDLDSAGSACPCVHSLHCFTQPTVFIYVNPGAGPETGPCCLTTEHLNTTVTPSLVKLLLLGGGGGSAALFGEAAAAAATASGPPPSRAKHYCKWSIWYLCSEACTNFLKFWDFPKFGNQVPVFGNQIPNFGIRGSI